MSASPGSQIRVLAVDPEGRLEPTERTGDVRIDRAENVATAKQRVTAEAYDLVVIPAEHGASASALLDETTDPAHPADVLIGDVDRLPRLVNTVESVTGGLDRRLSALLNNIDDVLWMFSADWEEVVYINEAYDRLTASDARTLADDPPSLFEIIHPEDRERVNAAMTKAADHGHEDDIEFRIKDDGGYRWVWSHAYPITDDDGHLETIAGVTYDISERKEHERRRRRERDRFLRLFEHFPEPTLAYRFEGDRSIIKAINREFEDIFGYDEDQALDTPVDDLVAPEDRREEARRLDERVREGAFIDTEVVRDTIGGQRHFRLRNVPLEGDDQLDGFAIYADIEARKRRERSLNALHETTRELTTARNKRGVAEIAVDAARSVIDLPVAAVWLRQGDGLDLVVATPQAREHVDEHPGQESIIRESFERDETRHLESAHGSITAGIALPLGDHGVCLLGTTTATAMGDLETTLGRVLAGNVEAALGRVEREVELREHREQLARQNTRLDEFASVVSHDLRTPMAVARSSLDHAVLDHEDLELPRVERALDRMDEIIEGTLTLARKGGTVESTQPVDLTEFVPRCLLETNIEDVDLAIDPDLEPIAADPDRLRHVFENLLRNASEHAGPAATVTVSGLPGGFAVSDDGPGLAGSDHEHIFDAGYTTNDDGSGLGLAIVKRIAEAHGWEVTVTEADTGGARFEFTGVDRP